jgi:predicted tellurium resistance membrane protein TerC
LPYSIGWLIEKRVMQLTARGVVTEYELRSLLEDCSRLSLQGTKPIYSIVDALDMTRTSFGVDTLKAVAGIRTDYELVVVVTTNMVAITLARAAATIFAQQLVVTAAVDDAKLTISQHDPSIRFP